MTNLFLDRLLSHLSQKCCKRRVVKAKEGIVLDRDGTPLTQPSLKTGARSFLMHFSTGPWLGTLIVIFFIFAGLTLVSTFGTILFSIWISTWVIRSLLSLFGIRRS